MSKRYLLDTNILSDAIKNHSGIVANRIAQLERENGSIISTSIIVAAELRYGAIKRNSSALLENVERVLQSIEVLPLDQGTDEAYATLRVDLEKRGLIIGANDLLIAAHALATHSVLVTANMREFARVKALTVENWLR